MGPELADICNMHDRISETIPEAIQRHGGEGAAAGARFFKLSATDQAVLVAFVAGL